MAERRPVRVSVTGYRAGINEIFIWHAIVIKWSSFITFHLHWPKSNANLFKNKKSVGCSAGAVRWRCNWNLLFKDGPPKEIESKYKKTVITSQQQQQTPSSRKYFYQKKKKKKKKKILTSSSSGYKKPPLSNKWPRAIRLIIIIITSPLGLRSLPPLLFWRNIFSFSVRISQLSFMHRDLFGCFSACVCRLVSPFQTIYNQRTLNSRFIGSHFLFFF